MNGHYFSCIGFTLHISDHFTLTTNKLNKLNIMNCLTNFFQLQKLQIKIFVRQSRSSKLKSVEQMKFDPSISAILSYHAI